jgi:transcriptional regulator with XRE-family HTH domain
MLRKRAKTFIDELGLTITAFCRNVGLSRTSVWEWLKGNRELSETSLERIDSYLRRYNF